ncbi:MAG: hypothetical protein QGG20_02245 [Dehalococcoidia bacterium]|nr:hypothetical protein [Dehalococcoidia bacterium]
MNKNSNVEQYRLAARTIPSNPLIMNLRVKIKRSLTADLHTPTLDLGVF